MASSKRKGWWEENVENDDKSAKRPKNLDEENGSNSSNSEPPEIEIDEKSWNKIMSDNDESHVSEPWPGGMFSNQTGTSLCGGYNLPPALNEIGLMYSPRNSDSFEQEEPKNTPKSRDSNNEVIEDKEDVPLQVRFSKKSLKSARRKAGRPKTKNEEEKSLSKESKDEPKDNNNSILEIDEDKIQLAQSYEEQNLESNQKNSNTDEEKTLKAHEHSAVAPKGQYVDLETKLSSLNFSQKTKRTQLSGQIFSSFLEALGSTIIRGRQLRQGRNLSFFYWWCT